MQLVHEADHFLLHSSLLHLLTLLGFLEGVDESAVRFPHLLHKPHQVITHTLREGERERVREGEGGRGEREGGE